MPTKTKKKAAPKKVTKVTRESKKKSQKTEKMALICAHNDECFWTTDGKVLANLVELRDTLDSMAEEVFTYHVNKEKNDFADWVESVLQDAELAAALRKAKKASTAKTVVVRRLKIYEA